MGNLRAALMMIATLAMLAMPAPGHAEYGVDDMFKDALGKLLRNSKEGGSEQSNDTVRVPVSRQDVQLSFAPLVKRVAPAVVNVYSRRVVRERSSSPFFSDPFFQRFFGGRSPFSERERERVRSSLGSGVIISPDGVVIKETDRLRRYPLEQTETNIQHDVLPDVFQDIVFNVSKPESQKKNAHKDEGYHSDSV